MTDLFGEAYSGKVLHVSHSLDDTLLGWFPEVNRQSEYREADAYLWALPLKQHPRNIGRFLVNWMKKSKRFAARNPGIKAELMAGSGPELPAGAKVVRRGIHSGGASDNRVSLVGNRAAADRHKDRIKEKPMTREELAEAIKAAIGKL